MIVYLSDGYCGFRLFYDYVQLFYVFFFGSDSRGYVQYYGLLVLFGNLYFNVVLRGKDVVIGKNVIY